MSCCPTKILPVLDASHDQSKSDGDKIYIAGHGNKKGIVFCPDIFGPHPNAYHVADILAARGFLVVMPDFFRGEHWDIHDFPPADGWQSQKWTDFLSNLTYDRLKPRVTQGISILKALGATTIGGVGFCWGACMVMNALAEGLIQSGAVAHPSMLSVELLEKAQGPVCLLPTHEDGELLDIKAAAESTGHKVVYQYFNDVHHGFVSARADFNNELNRKRANEAIDVMVEFFHDTM